MKFWSNFAKESIPGESTNSIKWEPYDTNKSRILKFWNLNESLRTNRFLKKL